MVSNQEVIVIRIIPNFKKFELGPDEKILFDGVFFNN